MENQGILLYIGIGFIVLLVLWYIWTANNLIAKRNRVKQCRSGICVVLKQRNDMIPNLVAAVKSYMGHENETLLRITELRSRTFQPSQESEQIRTGAELSSLLSRLQLSVEDYPELKANEQFHRLQTSIEDMELQLQAIRRTYNAAVTDYNNFIEMFPSSIVARQQNHHQEELIDIPEAEQRNVDVSELLKRV
ncbi:LemA family protein [Bacteroides oleiciplenus]|uniref:LemA family protein n=1 Tax=Bacteroides oleiciplenus TaxID=626931 RepID=A0A3E5AXY1_9BACE|nr:LemA family protein [Bacteroides oleiciplenus]RGN30211.1 LemA family protein [Bacteroides oleiciplenus]